MFKRIIKIILILLVVFLLIIGIIWLIERHKSEESTGTTLSFKQFVGLGSKESGAGNNSDTLSSLFNHSGSGSNTTNNNNNGSGLNNNGNGNNGSNALSNATNVSTFTDNGFFPTGNGNGLGNGTDNGLGGAPGSGSTVTNGTGDNGSGNTTGDDSGGDTTSGDDSGTGGPVCGTQDTTITFTPDQLAELNTLQNRFYSLAATLHTDADVAAEQANHDAFALRADQITELYNYCESKLPLITNPRLQVRVATPFWDAWNATDTPANQFWNTSGIAQSSGPAEKDSLTFLDFSNDPGDAAYLTSIHDNKNSSTSPKDTSGITGPYGAYNFSNPQVVLIDGSILKTPTVLLMPVVEHILRINLW